ncbi:MAG: alpha/beta hydrolase [Comamonadaceae bacterium]|nr:MAG: alpha/beta hydrolase [Comamonadaceae bacterium]
MTRSPSLSATAALVESAPVGVRLYGSKRKGGNAPLVIHFHGGAFISGNLDSGEPMSTLLAGAGAVVVSVDYPLAPAHPFPQAVEAGYSVLEWVYKNRVKLAGPAPRIFLAGEEAGGNIAAAVALVARDRAHPPVAGQILVTPMLDPCVATASQREAMGADTECLWSQGWQKYLQNPMDYEHPYAVPGQVQRMAGLPPTLVMAGADDPMRDEAQRYAERLNAGGIAAHFLLLDGRTGWPESLTEDVPPNNECACSASVTQHLSLFMNAPAQDAATGQGCAPC